MTDTDDDHHHGDDDDWIGELIDKLIDAALDIHYCEDVHGENADTKPAYKAADAAFDEALDVVDLSCVSCVRQLVTRLAFGFAHAVAEASVAKCEAEQLEAELDEQEDQRWRDELDAWMAARRAAKDRAAS